MQSCSVDNNLFVIKQNNKFGYINKNGKIIIEPKYNNAENFTNGFAFVLLDSTWMLINKKQRVFKTTCLLYPYNHGFSEGLCAFIDCKTMKTGYINNKGLWVIEPKYDEARDFHQGLAAVCLDKKWFYIDKRNTQILTNFDNFRYLYDFNNNLAGVETKSSKKGYINKNGKLVIDTIYEFHSGEFSENLINVRYNGKFDYIDKNGKYITNNKFIIAYEFIENKAIVSVYVDEYYEKFGIINKQGEFIVKPQYKYIQYPGYSEGLVVIEDFNNLYGYIDKNGKIIIKPQFKSASNFKNGIASVTLYNEKNANINKKGNIIWIEK